MPNDFPDRHNVSVIRVSCFGFVSRFELPYSCFMSHAIGPKRKNAGGMGAESPAQKQVCKDRMSAKSRIGDTRGIVRQEEAGSNLF